MSSHTEATLDDLAHAGGKAELVHGEIVLMNPASDDHNRAAGNIYYSLRQFEGNTPGRAFTDNAGFLVSLPHRKSFSPDAAWYLGPRGGRGFLPTAPAFAVEVRSDEDYGPVAEARLAAKRADYFAAGTLVVWDVDLTAEEVVRVYRAEVPAEPLVFRRGETAHAEPAVPGWNMPVDALFE